MRAEFHRRPKNQLFKSRTSIKRDIAYIGILLGCGLTLTFANFWYVNLQDQYDRNYYERSGELRVISQSIAKNAAEAVDGNRAAFKLLKNSRDEFQYHLDILKGGEVDKNNIIILPPSPKKIREGELNRLGTTWDAVTENVKMIIINQGIILELKDLVARLEEQFLELVAMSQRIVDYIIINNGKRNDIRIVERQSLLAEKILTDLKKIANGSPKSESSSNTLGRNVKRFNLVLESLQGKTKEGVVDAITNKEELNRIEKIKAILFPLEQSIGKISRTSGALGQVDVSANEIFFYSQELLNEATSLSKAYLSNASNRVINEFSGYLLSVFCLCMLLLLAYRAYINAQFSLSMTASQNKRNETAIQQLIEEIADLAEGDLSMHATVSEGITGAIADSINYAINALRKLIFTINETTEQVSTAAQKAQSIGRKLAEASENQAHEIVGATASVNAMATSIEHVSTNASKSADVASKSVSIAKNGVTVVQRMIMGMGKIRQQIQETAKRVKRLGESSQEIGDTVSLIDDIADQTNILSLNAAIQAAMAGEAGRGFAVVADEVQRLAENSQHATKEIEGLVKTIQHDTNQAVISMEQTTAEVVQGAKFAEDAGVALENIENVSNHLAELIQSISDEAKQQAITSSKISKTMDVIQDIAKQTASGTSATASSIGTLAELVIDLRNSVAGFKLPSDFDEQQ